MALACAAIGLAPLQGVAAAVWVAGHMGPGGRWQPGHWVGGVGPRPGPGEGPPPNVAAAGRVWLAGHFNGQHWVPGHWAAR